jgi:hypothetical protein
VQRAMETAAGHMASRVTARCAGPDRMGLISPRLTEEAMIARAKRSEVRGCN